MLNEFFNGSLPSGDALYVDDVFSTYLYEGNGTSQTITNGIDLSGEGGLVWIKKRSGADSHALFDTERGSSSLLRSDTTNAALTTSNGITSFNSDGFSLGPGVIGTNASGEDIVSWTFRKAPGFFDVVTYTGNDSSGTYTTTQTISHNLGGSAGMVMVRPINSTSDWYVNHNNSNPYVLKLNSNAGDLTADEDFAFTGPGTTFKVKGPNTNANGVQYIAYVFARGNASNEIFGKNGDESIIKTGAYNGNSSTDGPEINLGWEPQFVMIKRLNQLGNWMIFDTMRGMTLQSSGGVALQWNSSSAEGNAGYVRPTATGFKLQHADASVNSSSGDNTYIYMAIRRPHKPATAGTEVFDAYLGSANSLVNVGFPADLALAKNRNPGTLTYLGTRLQGKNFTLFPTNTNTEDEGTNKWAWDAQDEFLHNQGLGSCVAWTFKRAPGFLDVVGYEGDGVNDRAITHSLGQTPELIIIKNKDSTTNWPVWSPDAGTDNLAWDEADAAGILPNRIKSATQTTFTVGNYSQSNGSGNSMIALLFGTVPGVSKVGSYAGTGSSQTIDCGFTSGARWIMIKPYDTTGSWLVFDTERGINAGGNDPYLRIDTNALESTGDDYIDPDPTGFKISTTSSTINGSGNNYIFIAIA